MTATRTQRKRRRLKAQDRCEASGKIKFRDAAQAMLFVGRGEAARYFYRCPDCGCVHITKRRRTG